MTTYEARVADEEARDDNGAPWWQDSADWEVVSHADLLAEMDVPCSCSHQPDDHTPGNGCERRWCGCRWWGL